VSAPEETAEPRSIVWKRRLGPGLVLGVEDSLNIVLEADPGLDRHTLTNVDEVKAALDDARALVQFAEALHKDWPGEPERVLEAIRYQWPTGDEIDD
jgi:hypothetical protein